MIDNSIFQRLLRLFQWRPSTIVRQLAVVREPRNLRDRLASQRSQFSVPRKTSYGPARFESLPPRSRQGRISAALQTKTTTCAQ